ncbi:MAG: HAD hydrolase-like protein [Bacteroidales bacterium]|nr:HAD hydrolase-like protein [Bacteroidales bacterium]
MRKIKLPAKTVIVWDWNGTLLDDVGLCVSCMNVLLSKRGIPQMTVGRYREIFTFPVREYYRKAGFDFQQEDFEVPAMEFITLYYQSLPQANLFSGVENLLVSFRKKNVRQLVLSAMEHEKLVHSLKSKGIFHFFNKVSGLTDHYAHSKLEIGQVLLAGETAVKSEMLLVGDSLHDLEVANDLGIDCALVARGHQSKERLLEKTEWVFDALSDVVALVG